MLEHPPYWRLSFVWAIQRSFARSSILLKIGRTGAASDAKIVLQPNENLLFDRFCIKRIKKEEDYSYGHMYKVTIIIIVTLSSH